MSNELERIPYLWLESVDLALSKLHARQVYTLWSLKFKLSIVIAVAMLNILEPDSRGLAITRERICWYDLIRLFEH